MKYFDIRFGMYPIGESCSKLKYKPDIADRVMEVLAILARLSACVVAILLYIENGKLESRIWFDLILSLFLLFLLFTGAYAPANKIYYPVKITKNNVVFQYKLVIRTIRLMNILLGIFFFLNILSYIYLWAMFGRLILPFIMLLSISVYYVIAIIKRI